MVKAWSVPLRRRNKNTYEEATFAFLFSFLLHIFACSWPEPPQGYKFRVTPERTLFAKRQDRRSDESVALSVALLSCADASNLFTPQKTASIQALSENFVKEGQSMRSFVFFKSCYEIRASIRFPSSPETQTRVSDSGIVIVHRHRGRLN